MIVTNALVRWSRSSNRRRALEIVTRWLPWLAAAVGLTFVALDRSGTPAGITIAAASTVALAIGVIRGMRRLWRRPVTTAQALDHDHKTADLLQSAMTIESRGFAADAPLEQVVVARAVALVPTLESSAVARLKLRISTAGTFAALAVTALLLLTGGAPTTSAAAVPQGPPALKDSDKATARAIAKAIDAIANDPTASADARASAAKARDALNRAARASTAAAALAEMSEAARHLDTAARQLSAVPTPDEAAKLSQSQLADQMAAAAAAGDTAKLAALARDALRRADANPADAAALGAAMRDAAARAATAGGKPDGKGGMTPKLDADAIKRLAALGSAADSMTSGDTAQARATLGDLAKAGKSPGAPGARPSPSAAGIDAARDALASLRAAQRDTVQAADARANAARAAAAGKPGAGTAGAGKPGAGMAAAGKPGAGAGKPGGPGMVPGAGGMPGGKPGSGPAKPGSGPPGGGISVLSPGGAAGTSGTHGASSPSGAGAPPDTVMAEQVDSGPPITSEGAIHAIAERAAGEAQSETFGPVRDHYEAIAEAAIRRDHIPLTRRDFIQRYFAALRTHEDK